MLFALSFQICAQSDSIQSEDDKRFLFLFIGSTIINMQDDQMSPVRYSNGVLTGGFGWERLKSSGGWFDLRLNFMAGRLSSVYFDQYGRMTGQYYRFDLDFSYLHSLKVLRTNWNRFYLGGGFHSMTDGRFMEQLDNSALLYDHFNSFAFEFGDRMQFRLGKKKWIYSSRISLPVLSWGTRPDYLNLYPFIDPEDNLFSDAIDNGRWVSFGDFFRIIWRHELYYPIKGDNALKLTYDWQYFSANFTEDIKAGSHGIYISALLNF
jgi:hypothetical protein